MLLHRSLAWHKSDSRVAPSTVLYLDGTAVLRKHICFHPSGACRAGLGKLSEVAGVSKPRQTFDAITLRARWRHSQMGPKQWGLNHLDRFFEGTLANDITTRSLQAFVNYRKRESASGATISRNLGLLRRMFRLAAPDNPLLKIPNFAAVHFNEHHVRQGFLDAANGNCFWLCPRGCALSFRSYTLLASAPGRRERFNGRRWTFDAGVIRLSKTQTKTGIGRILPLGDELAMLKAERK